MYSQFPLKVIPIYPSNPLLYWKSSWITFSGDKGTKEARKAFPMENFLKVPFNSAWQDFVYCNLFNQPQQQIVSSLK